MPLSLDLGGQRVGKKLPSAGPASGMLNAMLNTEIIQVGMHGADWAMIPGHADSS